MTLEQQLFSWEGWDGLDEGVYQFDDVVLKVDIGEFKAGHKFSSAVVSFMDSTVEFFDDPNDQDGHKFELKLSVGKQLANPAHIEDCDCNHSGCPSGSS